MKYSHGLRWLATNVGTKIQGQQKSKSTSGWIIKYCTQSLISSEFGFIAGMLKDSLAEGRKKQ
jgi:hypothetical protein